MSTNLKTYEPDPTPYTQSVELSRKGLKYEKPPFTYRTELWEPKAQDVLSANSWGYVYNSAGTGETTRKNAAAFQKWSIVPSRMIECGAPDMSTNVLGHKLPYPVAICPIGVQQIFNPDGECATARACLAESVPYILSTATSTSTEDVAKANGDGVPENNGYTALFVTLDAYMAGWRPGDMDNGYNPFLRSDNIGTEIGFPDPVFRRKYKEQTGKEIEDDLGKSHTWKDLGWLRQHWDGPIVLKGILTAADARRAAQAGMNGVVASNHGGREQDGGIASLDALPKVVQALHGTDVEVFFDSGIRCGAAISKALALGAKMVLIGRPYIYGLALGGQAGVQHVLKALLGELDLTMLLSGVKSTSRGDLNEDQILRET